MHNAGDSTIENNSHQNCVSSGFAQSKDVDNTNTQFKHPIREYEHRQQTGLYCTQNHRCDYQIMTFIRASQDLKNGYACFFVKCMLST